MKFDDTFAFDLKSPDGDAHIVCSELPLDIRHEISARLRSKDEVMAPDLVERYQTAMCESVIEITGLFDAKGEVTPARVHDKKISPKLLDVITTAAWAALSTQSGTTEKKSDSKPE